MNGFEFEILNTITYFVYVIIAIVMFFFAKKQWRELKWSWLFAAIIISTLVSYKMFFTLSERTDIIEQQSIMMKQSSQIRNDKMLDSYLKVATIEQVDKVAEREAELLKQKQKNEELIKQSFSKGEK